MPWVAHVGGHDVTLEDLPIEVLEQAEQDSGVPWFMLLDKPLANAKGARVLFELIAEHDGVDKPVGLTAKQTLALYDWNPGDSLPAVFDEGGIPDPKAEDGDQTAGSSGAPDSSDGLPTSPESSVSAT